MSSASVALVQVSCAFLASSAEERESMEALEISVQGTVQGWLDLAVTSIDDKFGDGFAKANPGLVAAFVNACAAQVRNERLREDVCGALDAIAASLADVAAAIVGHE